MSWSRCDSGRSTGCHQNKTGSEQERRHSHIPESNTCRSNMFTDRIKGELKHGRSSSNAKHVMLKNISSSGYFVKQKNKCNVKNLASYIT